MLSFFEKLIEPFPEGLPSQPPNTFYAFCRYYTQGVEKYILIMAFFTACIAVLEVTLFGFLGNLVDWMSNSDKEHFFNEYKIPLLGMGFVLTIILPSCIALHSLLLHQTILGNYPMRIRWMAHNYLLEQSADFYQNEFAGRIATKVMQTALAVRETVLKLLDVILYVLVYFASVVFLVGSLDIALMLPLIAWIILYLVVLYIFLPKLEAISSKQADARSEMTGRIVDTYTNMTTVKLFSHSKRESNYAKESMVNFLDTVHPQMRLATQLRLSVWILNIALILCVTIISILLWSKGSITTGAIAVAIALILRIYSMSQWIMWEISALFENIGTTKDGMSTLSTSKSIQDSPNALPLTVNQGEIYFNNVSFCYENNKTAIDQFSLKIRPGEKIGIVGRSGAGKSTLVNLLMRFYDINDGSITIDQQNIRQVSQNSLRKEIAFVTQDTSLLHRSVKENILYGKPDASNQDMIQAAKKAKAHEFIQELKDNKNHSAYDAQVGERGVKLSGGQRQRIAIARVLLKDAPILILDEATSALDSEVENAIQENLKHMMAGKTVIAIAHRLSTIAALDRLIVMDEGKIIEEGSHKELLDKGGVYSQLWAHQSGGFLP